MCQQLPSKHELAKQAVGYLKNAQTTAASMPDMKGPSGGVCSADGSNTADAVEALANVDAEVRGRECLIWRACEWTRLPPSLLSPPRIHRAGAVK